MADSEQGFPKRRGKKAVAWQEDVIILARLQIVERLHFSGRSNVSIARELDVDEGTVRNDLKRLARQHLERIDRQSGEIRARVAAELEDLKLRALDAAAFDELAERAVLFGAEVTLPDGTVVTVHRDDKGSAQFRGNKAASLNVARQSVMDRAKILGVVVDQSTIAGEVTVRRYIGVPVDDV